MSTKAQQQDQINRQALNETSKFIHDALSMIQQTYAACGVESFRPEPLNIPQVISDSEPFNPTEIANDDYFKQAEAMWLGQAQFFNGQMQPPPQADVDFATPVQDISQQMMQSAVEMNGPVDQQALQVSDPMAQEIPSDVSQILNGESS